MQRSHYGILRNFRHAYTVYRIAVLRFGMLYTALHTAAEVAGKYRLTCSAGLGYTGGMTSHPSYPQAIPCLMCQRVLDALEFAEQLWALAFIPVEEEVS
jgi:hypothetical protein